MSKYAIDLERGFLNMRPLEPPGAVEGESHVNRYHRSLNSWTTRITAYLELDNERAFLAGECRAENVMRRDRIFSKKLLEKAVIKGHDADWMSRWGAAHWHPFRPKSGRHIRYQRLAEQNIAVDVCADSRPIEEISSDQVLEDLRTNRWPPTYMRTSYEWRGQEHAICCPVKYINFPVSGQCTENYLQPITGYVLFYDGQNYIIGYLVTLIVEGRTQATEVLLRDKCNLLEAKAGMMSSRLRPIGILGRMLSPVFAFDEFSSHIRLDAETRFFRYLHHHSDEGG